MRTSRSCEQRKALGGDVAHVGEVGGGAEAVAGDVLAAVGDGDALEVRAEEVDCGAGGRVEAVELDAGAGGVAVLGAEGVVEDALDGGGGGRRRRRGGGRRGCGS